MILRYLNIQIFRYLDILGFEGNFFRTPYEQENAMKGLEGKKIFGHQNCQKSDVETRRSQGQSGAKLNSLKYEFSTKT